MNNWTRIDDDTYISNTLVTCAEYQAFIDEKIAQDKEYFQPHHWAGIHFPEGHADKPILGVSGQAGREFCHWLNQRQAEWWYLQPDEVEYFSSEGYRRLAQGVVFMFLAGLHALQYRIDGTYPAFEGLRLAKERRP